MNEKKISSSILIGSLVLYSTFTQALPPMKQQVYLDPDVQSVIVTATECVKAAPQAIFEVEAFVEQGQRRYKLHQYTQANVARALYNKPVEQQIRDNRIVGREFCDGQVRISNMNLPFTKQNYFSDANDIVLLENAMQQHIQNIYHIIENMMPLANKAASGHYSSSQLPYLDAEYQTLKNQMNQSVENATFNDVHLLNGKTPSILVVGTGGTTEVFLPNLTLEKLNMGSTTLISPCDAMSTLGPLQESKRIILENLQQMKSQKNLAKDLCRKLETITVIDVSTDNFKVSSKKTVAQ